MLSKRRLGPWFLFALLLILAWISLRVVGVFLDYLLIGIFLAFITYPIYRGLSRRTKRPRLSSLLMVLGVLATVIVPLAFLSMELVSEVQEINRELGLRDPKVLINETSQKLGAAFGVEPSGATADIVQGAYDGVRAFLQEQARDLPAQAAGLLVGLFVLFYVLYYAYLDGEKALNFVRGLVPMDDGHRDLLMFEVGQVVRGVMIGTVFTALIQAVLGGIGFAAVGVPNPLFWALMMFVLALLPVIGPPVVWAPWGVYLIAQGHVVKGTILLAYSAVFVSGVDNLIRPKLIGRAADIHPVTVLLGVLGGVVVFGFPGFILGPLVLSIFVTVLKTYRKDFESRHAEGKEMWQQ